MPKRATSCSIAEKIISSLRRLGWLESAISPQRPRTIRHQGIAVKVLNFVVAAEEIPYLLIVLLQNLKLADYSARHKSLLDIDEVQRLIINQFSIACILDLILIYDGKRGYLYLMPDEVLISYCDSPASFDERILGFLRPELAQNSQFFRDKREQLASSLAKELQKWLHQWEIKLSSVVDIPRQGRINFMHKLLLWRMAANTGINEFAWKKLQRYIFPEERLKLKRPRLPDATKDTLQVLDALMKDNNLEFCRTNREDLLLLRKLRNGNMLCRLLRELNLLCRYKFSATILAKYADLELKNKNEVLEARVEGSTYRLVESLSKKLTRTSVIIEAPIPYSVNLKITGFETLLQEIVTAFDEIQTFKYLINSERRGRKNSLFIQPDLFAPRQKCDVVHQDILGALVGSGIRTTVYNEESKDFVRFFVTAALIELRDYHKLSLTRFPSLAPIFSA